MPPITDTIIAKIRERSERGLAKYGQSMDRTDLTPLDWLNHAQQEAMDLAQYIEVLIRLNGKCQWKMKGLTWATGCDEACSFDFGPRFSDFKFCPFCGRVIEEGK